MRSTGHFLVGVFLSAACSWAGQTFALDSTKGLAAHDVTVEAVTYQGRRAVRILPSLSASAEQVNPKNDEGGGIAGVTRASFHDGSIEVAVAGKPRPGAAPDARGFVGVALWIGLGTEGYFTKLRIAE